MDRPRRILCFGCTGSGKTTLAMQLADVLGLPLVRVDDVMFEADWQTVPQAEQRRRIEAICAGNAWILDHAYGAWRDIPVAAADLIVAFDYPRWLSLSRLLRRTVRRVVTRERVCNGNVETLRHQLSRESILLWHFHSFASKRRFVRQLEQREAPGRLVVLRRRGDAEELVVQLSHEFRGSVSRG